MSCDLRPEIMKTIKDPLSNKTIRVHENLAGEVCDLIFLFVLNL